MKTNWSNFWQRMLVQFLWYGLIFNLFSSFIGTLIEIHNIYDNAEIRDNWTLFARVALSLICAGFLGVIYAVREKTLASKHTNSSTGNAL